MLSLVDVATILTSICTLIAAIALMTRVPWRMGFLCLMVGLMPLTHILVLLKTKLAWPVSVPKPFVDIAELLVGSLFLVAIMMLRIDAQERLSQAARLRLAEAMVPQPQTVPPNRRLQQLDRIGQLRSMLQVFAAWRSAKQVSQGAKQDVRVDRLL